jgi:prophage antirepressor-like protein
MEKPISTRTESWNNHDIRFVERDGEWWAVAKDVAKVLGIGITVRRWELLPLRTRRMSAIPSAKGRRQGRILSKDGSCRFIFLFHYENQEALAFLNWMRNFYNENSRHC